MRTTGPAPAVGHLHPIADEELEEGAARRLVLRAGLGEQTSDLRLCEAANRILRGLENPRITTARTVGRDTQGRLVLTYDSEERIRLSLRLEESPEFVVHVLTEVCAALDAAHSLGVIHGALTPDSVRMTAEPDTPTVSVADFGLGHLFGPQAQLHDRPQWLPYSPEKQLGLEPTPAEDVYLVGALGFAMITGRPLFEGPTRAQLLRQHAIESPTSLLDEELDCDPWLAQLLERCLHKEPEERFPSPADLARALRDRPHNTPRQAEPVAGSSPPEAAARAQEQAPSTSPAEETASQEQRDDPTRRSTSSPRRMVPVLLAVAAAAVVAGVWGVRSVGSSGTPSQVAPSARTSDVPAAPAGVVAPTRPPVASASHRARDKSVDPPARGKSVDPPILSPPGSATEPDPIDTAQEEQHRAEEAIRLTQRARSALKSGNNAKAARLYRRALSIHSEHAVAAYELGQLHFAEGDVAAAIQSAKRATGSAPRNAAYRLALGDYYAESGNETAAHKHWTRAANLGNETARQRLPSG